MGTIHTRAPRGTGSPPPTREEFALSRSCCCQARPAVLVLMPATMARPHETDLLLCGHHFRASRRTLAAAGAAVRRIA